MRRQDLLIYTKNPTLPCLTVMRTVQVILSNDFSPKIIENENYFMKIIENSHSLFLIPFHDLYEGFQISRKGSHFRGMNAKNLHVNVIETY